MQLRRAGAHRAASALTVRTLTNTGLADTNEPRFESYMCWGWCGVEWGQHWDTQGSLPSSLEVGTGMARGAHHAATPYHLDLRAQVTVTLLKLLIRDRESWTRE